MRHDRTQLSDRENEVLELAMQGLSDKEIAYRMELSPATVNSYWVRIRGKLGHHTRSEFISQVLRQESAAEMDLVHAAYARTIALDDDRSADRAAMKLAHFYKDTLNAVPEAMLVLETGGIIEFANALACSFLGCSQEELVGKDIRRLFPRHEAFAQAEAIQSAIRSDHVTTLGVSSQFYLKRQDNSDFRIFMTVNTTRTRDGIIAVCMIKPFLDELKKRGDRANAVANAQKQ